MKLYLIHVHKCASAQVRKVEALATSANNAVIPSPLPSIDADIATAHWPPLPHQTTQEALGTTMHSIVV